MQNTKYKIRKMKNEMSAILVIGREMFEIYFHKYLDDIWGSFCQIYDLRAAQTESEFVEATNQKVI